MKRLNSVNTKTLKQSIKMEQTYVAQHSKTEVKRNDMYIYGTIKIDKFITIIVCVNERHLCKPDLSQHLTWKLMPACLPVFSQREIGSKWIHWSASSIILDAIWQRRCEILKLKVQLQSTFYSSITCPVTGMYGFSIKTTLGMKWKCLLNVCANE